VALYFGLLIAPASQKTREAAQRTLCINNLRELGIAVHNYAGANQTALPPLTCDKARKEFGSYNGGLYFTLLPFMEPNEVFANACRTLPDCIWYAPIAPSSVPPFSTNPPGKNGLPFSTLVWKSVQCPADSTIANGYSDNQYQMQVDKPPYYFPWAASSYSSNYQVFGVVNDFGSPGSGNSCGPKYGIGNIPDGKSNTVFFGEQFAACGTSAGNLWAYPGIGNYSGPAYSTARGAHAPVGVGDSIVNTPDFTNSKLWAPVFANSHAKYGFSAGGSAGSVFEANRQRHYGQKIEAPYAVNAFWDAPPQFNASRDECDKSRLQSFHRGAVMAGMGDGSVRVVQDGVTQSTWYSAILPADGVALGPDW
jgi:hypothetical protein